MVFIGFGCFSRFWVGLVVVALVGMSGKGGNVWFSLLVDIKIQFLLINLSLSGYSFDILGRRYMFIKEFKGS